MFNQQLTQVLPTQLESASTSVFVPVVFDSIEAGNILTINKKVYYNNKFYYYYSIRTKFIRSLK